jgi:hypothetical protein
MNEDTSSPEALAVIGMAGRFPDARNPDEFWNKLIAGKDGITRFPGRAGAAGEKYVGARSLFGQPDLFDAPFFGIYPEEAELAKNYQVSGYQTMQGNDKDFQPETHLAAMAVSLTTLRRNRRA